ncbi:hypothetical protein J6590_000531 [Homalodisca vitripennis]|nr:hypothetical protein J6590_000531 [Homalodisca vitripennis]
MDRSRSPSSENTIRRVVEEEYLDESFVSDVIVSEDDNSDSCLLGMILTMIPIMTLLLT